MRPRRRAPRRLGGFTLIEVLVALGVTAIGMFTMLMLQVQVLKEGSRGRHRTSATMIARDQLELIQSMAFSNAGLDVMDPATWTTPPWLANAADPDLAPGEIAATVRRPGETTTEIVFTVNYLVTADNAATPNPDLRRVDLEVVWTEDDVSNNRPTRTGQPTVALSTVLVNNDR